MTDKISMIELFEGIGSQERAMRQLNIPFEVTHYCDLDIKQKFGLNINCIIGIKNFSKNY